MGPPTAAHPHGFSSKLKNAVPWSQDLGAQPVQTPRQVNSSARASSRSPGTLIQGGLKARELRETSTSGMTARRNQVDSFSLKQ